MKSFLLSFLVLVVGATLGGGSIYLWKQAEIDSLGRSIFELTRSAEEATSEEEEADEPDAVDAYEGVVLPQVYIMAAAYYDPAELEELQTKIVDPLVAYYEGLGLTIVSISIDNDNRSSSEKSRFTVSCIIAQADGDQEPSYFGFLVDKVDGEIPLWEPEEVPEGYRG